LGLDIGGANTKAAYIKTQKGTVEEFQTALEYFPIWKRSTKQLIDMLLHLRKKMACSAMLDCVGATMTAELSDKYTTKTEGVNDILDALSAAFDDVQLLVLDVDAGLLSLNSARAEPLRVAAANWAATGWMVAQKISNCVVVDVGSTSTSIIPITDGKVAAAGKTDLQKLMNGELVYTGSLRTNVAATVNSAPLRGGIIRISSELFAQSGDVHQVLGNIAESDYTSETADGKGKTRNEALTRLARVVCADTNMLSEQEILEIAKYVYAKQVEQIANGLSQVYSQLKADAKKTVPTVITGLGKDFLARRAGENAGVATIIDMEEIFPRGAGFTSPAVGVGLMVSTKLEGGK
jgi:(4-(4-[2-(gamma-L-glutamylamino)ethyl]phenoxymethyl)furan-2-yl)methanamine synthase